MGWQKSDSASNDLIGFAFSYTSDNEGGGFELGTSGVRENADEA